MTEREGNGRACDVTDEIVSKTFRRLIHDGRLKEGKGIVSKDTHLGSSVNTDTGAPLGRRWWRERSMARIMVSNV